MENTTNMNKMDGVGESLLERMRRSREIKDATLIQSNVKPIKSILKKSNQSPIKEARKVSMNSSTMVWVVETDYASPSRMDAVGSINKILNTGDTSIDASDSNYVAKQEAGPQNTFDGNFVGKRLRYVGGELFQEWYGQNLEVKQFNFMEKSFCSNLETNGMAWISVENVFQWLIKWCIELDVWSSINGELKKILNYLRRRSRRFLLGKVSPCSYSSVFKVDLVTLPLKLGNQFGLTRIRVICELHSWGRSAYARALIEVSAEDSPKEDLVIAIPRGKDKGHSLATIHIEYEWKPPSKRWKVKGRSKINTTGLSPNDTADDGFEVVKKKKKRKQNKHQKQVDGVVLNKPSLQLHYRRVEKGNTSINSDPKSNVASTSNVGGSMPSSTGDQLKSVPLVNSFSALNEDEDCDWKDPNSWQHSRSVLNESGNDVDEVITLDDHGGSLKTI
ncbi:hypothetical protein Tco_0698995 [Tanacetum coccineum]